MELAYKDIHGVIHFVKKSKKFYKYAIKVDNKNLYSYYLQYYEYYMPYFNKIAFNQKRYEQYFFYNTEKGAKRKLAEIQEIFFEKNFPVAILEKSIKIVELQRIYN